MRKDDKNILEVAKIVIDELLRYVNIAENRKYEESDILLFTIVMNERKHLMSTRRKKRKKVWKKQGNTSRKLKKFH